jgi:hypothetical protein
MVHFALIIGLCISIEYMHTFASAEEGKGESPDARF